MTSSASLPPRPIGYQVTQTYCRECAPEGLRDGYAPMREGDDHGVPYHCDQCGGELLPCEHEWSEWRRWYAGGEFRICDRAACGETEHRDGDGRPIARPQAVISPRPEAARA